MPSPAPSRLRAAAASPIVFLMTLAFVNWLGFASWQALLNNFAKDAAGFDGFQIGVLQSVREIPGFLAFTAAFLFMIMREQTLAYLSILMLGVGVALTGYLPSFWGLILTTTIMSVGFHYFETANQALSLQLLTKKEAPRGIGKIYGAAAAAQLVAYGGIAGAFLVMQPSYEVMYLVAGGATIGLGLLAMAGFRRFQGETRQNRGIVLRRRYWLYYALTFLSGARRQIFMAFGAFLLVERFGYEVSTLAQLLFLTCAVNVVAAPLLGRAIGRFGERATILAENMVLVVVFLGYAFTGSALVAGALFVLDGVFFTLTIAQKTYFQKIGDPADIAPTASVAFTINHIAAVAMPVTFGVIWMSDPSAVFLIGAAIACGSLALAFLVPRHPDAGRETVLSRPAAAPIPAE
ncbi:MFS transporter [Salinarimonas rosea]|uniref:MFS transporter n=1 Tax=Salinarimonas rosea TaxID=552063 RepID=UPI00048B08C5|nr:MFS transporter [Salinarimonas rosea]